MLRDSGLLFRATLYNEKNLNNLEAIERTRVEAYFNTWTIIYKECALVKKIENGGRQLTTWLVLQ